MPRTRRARRSRCCSASPGFFSPRVPPAPFQPPGTRGGDQLLRHRAAAATLERLVDFDLLNSRRGPALGRRGQRRAPATSATSTPATQRLDVRHIMASGALPPGFPPVEIDGEYYWDGGLVSNTPLQYVLDQPGSERRAGVPGRPVQRPRRDAGDAGRGHRAREGHPLLEPHAAEHHDELRRQAIAAGGAPPDRASCRRACATTPTRRRSPRCPLRGGRRRRAPDLPQQALREPVEGLRVLARLDARALGGRPRRHRAHARRPALAQSAAPRTACTCST